MMCPCGSGKEYERCCGAFHKCLKKAETPEELMRSRYSAFVKGEAEYLLATGLSSHHASDELEQLKAQMGRVEWLKLDLLEAKGTSVEFKAYYRENKTIHLLHEKSRFVYQDGQWFYDEGTLYNSKIERNEQCPCGSGKKFKKCCGRL